MWGKGLIVDKNKAQKTESHLYDCFQIIFFVTLYTSDTEGFFYFTFSSFLIIFCSNGKIENLINFLQQFIMN